MLERRVVLDFRPSSCGDLEGNPAAMRLAIGALFRIVLEVIEGDEPSLQLTTRNSDGGILIRWASDGLSGTMEKLSQPSHKRKEDNWFEFE